MAQEAFSDQKVADYLNAHFVAIKVDREQRPDIDQYAMAFIFELSGPRRMAAEYILYTKATADLCLNLCSG